LKAVWAAYPALEAMARKHLHGRVFVGAVEGCPEAEEVVSNVLKAGFSKVCLVPFMLVAGVHFQEDLFWMIFQTGQVQAENAAQTLEEVVVTSTRSEQKSFDLPAPVSVLDEQHISQKVPASVSDVLQDVPGVEMERAGSWEASPIIRGLGSNRVLVLIDGDRETNLWAGRSPLNPFVDVGSIERVEVVKGPASALYGTDALGASLEMGTSLGTRHQLVGGLEFVREETDSSEQQMVLRDADQLLRKRTRFEPVPTANRSHLGVFVQDDISVGDKLVVIAGGRYDYFTADADDVPYTVDSFDEQGELRSSKTEINAFFRETDRAGSLNLGLLYPYTEHVHLTTNLGTGFRAPDIFERYSTRGGGSRVIIGNPSLDPEYSYNADVGIKTRFDRFRGDVNVYYNRVDEYIDTVLQDTSFVSGSDINTYKYVNVQEAELYGFESTAMWELTKDIDLFGSAAYVVGKDRDTGERLSNILPLHGTVGATWEKKIRRNLTAWVEASGDFYDRQDNPAPGESETPGYAIANLAAGLRMHSWGPLQDLGLTLRVENLFDKYYRSHLRKDDRDYIPEPGCNVITSIACGVVKHQGIEHCAILNRMRFSTFVGGYRESLLTKAKEAYTNLKTFHNSSGARKSLIGNPV